MEHIPRVPLFDAEVYEGEGSVGSASERTSQVWDDDFISHTASSMRSSHPDNAHPRYVAPHARTYKQETGDDFAFPLTEKKGDEMGVENRHFARILVYISYALTKVAIAALHLRFPGVFFHCCDVVNHDHPVAHAVTVVGTRFLQRMIKAGSVVLDVYGAPNACEAFNRIQGRRRNPKVMIPLVNNFGGADFIREINKWGPKTDNDGERYFEGRIRHFDQDFYRQFAVFQMIHTLYYVSAAEIMHMLDASPGSKVLALIHTHKEKHGFLNEREQEYWVKGGMVKQRNCATGTCYFHPNITPFWFAEKKEHVLPGLNRGFSWECHLVCQDTWIIEIVRSKPVWVAPANDFEKLFRDAEAAELGFKSENLCFDEEPPNVLPTSDGKFIELRAENVELVGKLRTQATGRSRVGKEGAKLMLDLINLAKHLTDPSAVFEGQSGLSIDRATLADHVVKAFISDVPRELALMGAVDMLSPMLRAHAAKKVGPKVARGMSPLALMQNFRLLVQGGIAVNKVVRHKDVVGAGLQALDDALDDRVWGL